MDVNHLSEGLDNSRGTWFGGGTRPRRKIDRSDLHFDTKEPVSDRPVEFNESDLAMSNPLGWGRSQQGEVTERHIVSKTGL
jgi:hypothetical protein